VIDILQGSVLTQKIKTIFLSIGCKFPAVYAKNMKVGSRRNYCNNKQTYFFGPPCWLTDIPSSLLLQQLWSTGTANILQFESNPTKQGSAR